MAQPQQQQRNIPNGLCPWCAGAGMASPHQPGAEDVFDVKAGEYEDRHLCSKCGGTGQATKRVDNPFRRR